LLLGTSGSVAGALSGAAITGPYLPAFLTTVAAAAVLAASRGHARTSSPEGAGPVRLRKMDGIGARPVIFVGLCTLTVAAVLAATTPESDAPLRTGALFLLGYGWNLCYVGGSGRLARDLPESARASVEGAVDATIWGLAAVASLTSTMALPAAGYAALGWVACALLAVPAILLFRTARTLRYAWSTNSRTPDSRAQWAQQKNRSPASTPWPTMRH
jgi:hypothetical protein